MVASTALRSTTEKFNIINRETGIIAELLTSRLEAIRNFFSYSNYHHDGYLCASSNYCHD